MKFLSSMNSYYEKMADGTVRCIDSEIPFEIPDSWAWERWGNISFSIQYGYNAPALENGDIRMVRISDIQDNNVVWNKVPFCQISPIGAENYKLKRNDILFARTGGTVGKSFLVEENPMDAVFAGYLIRTRYSEELCSYYLKAFMGSSIYWEQLKSGTIATAQPNCNGKTLGRMLLPVPPKEEQWRIVNKIKNTTPYIERFSQNQDEILSINGSIKYQLRKSILQEAIQGKLVPQIASDGTADELLAEITEEKKRLVKEGKLKKSALTASRIFRGDDNKYYEQIGSQILDITEEIPFAIPNTWTWCRLNYLFFVNPKNDSPDDSEAAFIPMEKMNAGFGSGYSFERCKWKEIKKGFSHFADGDIAFAKITPCFQNRKGSVFENLPHGIGAGSTELKVLRVYGGTINPYFALYFLQSPYFIDEARFKGTANQQRLVSGYLENKLFPLPPLTEQNIIVAQIEALFERIK